MHDKREQIMRAAERLFVSRRFHEVTTDDIAREAQVGKGTIYRFFKDKDDLFFQTATSGFEALCDLLRTRPASGDVRADLVAACQCIGQFFQRRRQLFSMMQAEESRAMVSRGAPRQAWNQRRRKLAEALGEVIGRAADAGLIRTDLPPHVLALYLMSMLRARARDLADGEAVWRSDEVVVDLFLHGAGALAPSDGEAVVGGPPKEMAGSEEP